MNITHTDRGFARVEFTDRNEVPCSLQKSSIATEDCIWLGANDIGLKRFEPGKGWHDVVLEREPPGGVNHVANNRMHLSQENVRALLPLLQGFAATGDLEAAALTDEPPTIVDRLDGLWEDADALLKELRTHALGDPKAAQALGEVIACVAVIADAGRRASSAMVRHHRHALAPQPLEPL